MIELLLLIQNKCASPAHSLVHPRNLLEYGLIYPEQLVSLSHRKRFDSRFSSSTFHPEIDVTFNRKTLSGEIAREVYHTSRQTLTELDVQPEK